MEKRLFTYWENGYLFLDSPRNTASGLTGIASVPDGLNKLLSDRYQSPESWLKADEIYHELLKKLDDKAGFLPEGDFVHRSNGLMIVVDNRKD